MVSPKLSLYEEWVFNKDRSKDSFLVLLTELGWQDVAFINQTQGLTKLDACSDGFMVFLTSYYDNPNFVISKNGDIEVHGETFQCILQIDRDEFGNRIYVVGRTNLNTNQQKETKLIAKLAFESLQSYEKIQSLELVLPLINQHSVNVTSQNWKNLKVSNKFIDDSVPAVWYGVAHEVIGPIIIAAWPFELTEVEYLEKVVNVYSVMRSDLIVELGHVFSVVPVSSPYGGESTNVIFTIPNPKARGGVELHAVSVTIGRDFVNLSKEVYNELKTIIYNLVDFIKTLIGNENLELCLDNDPMNIRGRIRDYLGSELRNTQLNVSKLIGSLMEETDVYAWQ